MINQWETVKSLKCPIPTLPAYEYVNSTEIDYTTGLSSNAWTNLTTASTTTTTTSVINRRPIYCIKDGAEILDDLKIRPVSFWTK